MRKFSQISGLGFAGALLCAIAFLWTAAPVGAQTGPTYCEISLKDCPEAYNGKTLEVPLDVVSLSAKIRACDTRIVNEVVGGDPPAIMFLIDHSTSMNAPVGNDVNGNRYRVTQALIDSVYKAYPNAQVGIAVFASGLVLSKDRDPNLVEFGGTPFSTTAKESYMPLMQLDKPAKGGGFYAGDTPNAIDVYRSMFKIPTIQTQKAGIYGVNGDTIPEVSGTNITIAFEAALEQFAKIPNSVVKPENRYIIFLSDGEPGINGVCTGANGTGGSNPRCAMQLLFKDGFIGGQLIPTTYTVYLTTGSTTPIDTLVTMTNNIKNNGYSDANSTSAIWARSGGNYNALLTLMMENIITPMLTQTNSSARSMVVTSAGKTDSTGAVDSAFQFGRMLPIDTLEVTEVKMGIMYDVHVDTVDGNGQDSSYNYPEKIDYTFKIKRMKTPSQSLASQGLESNCAAKATISLWREENGTLVPVDTIKPNMSNLKVKFTKGDFFDYAIEDVNIRINMTASRTKNDTLYTKSLPYSAEPTTIVWDFVMEHHTPDGQINFGNNILEHNSGQDEVVLFFRNPAIPLDVVTLTVPYISHKMVFSSNPTSVNIMSDTTVVTAGKPLDIYALLLDAATGAIDRGLLETGSVTWFLKDSDGATITPESPGSSHAVFKATKAHKDYVVTAVFEASNGMTIENSFTVRVVPGEAKYLEVVFDDPTKKRPTEYVDIGIFKSETTIEIEKGVQSDTLYAVARDEFGNYIGPTTASWKEGSSSGIRLSDRGPSASTIVWRNGDEYSAGNSVVAEKDNLVSYTVNITVVGNALTSVGPNPFVPNESSPKEIYERTYPDVYKYYKEILDAPAVGGGSAGGNFGCTNCGILVAGTAPKGIKKEPNGRDPKATVIIYDAVGNIVFKSKPNEITLIEDKNTFGFVWNGKNNKGRIVGPGTYLVRMYVELDGDKFVEQRKIGVTKSTK